MKAIHSLLAAFLLLHTAPGAAQTRPDPEVTAQRILELANDVRRREGAPALTTEKRLTRAAASFASFMGKAGTLSHDADGNVPEKRAAKEGYTYCMVGENIAYEFNSAGFESDELAREFMDGWMRSPGHRRNLLDRDLTETGIAVARSERTGRYYAVQMFGRPRSQVMRFEVANETGVPIRYRIAERRYSLKPSEVSLHEECRPGAVTVEAPGLHVSATPSPGSRLAVRAGAGGLSLTRERGRRL